MELTIGVFGSEFGRKITTPFALETGQMRCQDKITHNSGWYSGAGDKLGWGDLSAFDFRRIQQSLEPDQVFVVLGERDSFWEFERNAIRLGCDSWISSPGRKYLGEYARYVITPTELLYVNDWDANPEPTFEYYGLVFRVISAEERTKFFAP